jgi:hypothetical protein
MIDRRGFAAHEAAEYRANLQMERLVEAVECAQLLEGVAPRQLGAVQVGDRNLSRTSSGLIAVPVASIGVCPRLGCFIRSGPG